MENLLRFLFKIVIHFWKFKPRFSGEYLKLYSYEKPSENENKVFPLSVTGSRKSGRGQEKVHENGRGEVSRFVLGMISMFHVTFFHFFLRFYPFVLTVAFSLTCLFTASTDRRRIELGVEFINSVVSLGKQDP
jgi:hypothetical protein